MNVQIVILSWLGCLLCIVEVIYIHKLFTVVVLSFFVILCGVFFFLENFLVNNPPSHSPTLAPTADSGPQTLL